KASADPFGTLIDGYLSEDHRADPAAGCSVAALAGDAALGREEARRLVARGIEGLAKAIGAIGAIDANTALALATQLVGGLVIARSVDDPALAARLLETSRMAARRLIGRD
ncbi:MAG: P1 family peptidase, partial [Rhodospirillaceae bacterium]